MCSKTLNIFLIFVFSISGAYAETPKTAVNFHLSFENFDFMEEDFVARSGFKSIDDRGLTLEEGRFGKGLQMNLVPNIPQQDEMTGIDLDMVTAVTFNTRHHKGGGWVLYNEPVLWGAGKLNPGSGAVSFWVKGNLKEGELLTQSAMAWGRKEKYLLSITVGKDQKIGAYLVDSRYVKHSIESNYRWDENTWNHIVLNWDKAQGLELFINGESAASSWGTDAWWQTMLPGLFLLPMHEIIYDELYIFSKPLSLNEITMLMNTNTVPELAVSLSKRSTAERNRLAAAIGISEKSNLPVIKPMAAGRVLSFKEITPAKFGDDHIPGRFCQDGRYELAWPHPVATFTIIPGDADFQAKKLDIAAPEGIPYNYITIEGNLKGMPAALFDCREENDTYTGKEFFKIPQDDRFFYGAYLKRSVHPPFTLPFLKGYGAPGEFSGNVRLPLTGETRIHEVSLFDVSGIDEESIPGEMVYCLRKDGSAIYRYDFAKKTMNPLVDRTTFYGYLTEPEGKTEWIHTGYLKRTNLLTAPMNGNNCFGRILFDIDVKTTESQDVLLVRLHDPGTPHRIWTHAEVKLQGFDNNGGRLRLMLDCTPIMVTNCDVIWIDITTLNDAQIKIGGSEGGRIVLKPAPFFESRELYEKKALMPTMAEYTKAYHHKPWTFEKIWPDIMNPHALGGQFDSVMPAMAVQQVLPHSRLAKYYVDWGGDKYYWGSFTDPKKNFPIKNIEIPEGIPRWAHLQHLIQNFRFRVVDFMAANQNPDGQLWGGWNDDTLILRGRPDIALDSCDRARDLFLKVYEGLDQTNLFGDGFCQIQPIDNVHNGDFVRERYKAVIFKLGDPYIMRRALQTAWHWDKPDKTPFNWGKGQPFMFDKNILEWYWGKNVSKSPYKSVNEVTLDENLSRLASYLDDILFHRFTEARNHTDASSIYNEHYVARMILGGNADASISVSWPEGGGEHLARWVTYADNAKIECRMFSFDPLERNVTARLFRIDPGTYKIELCEDQNGIPGRVLSSKQKEMKRFDTFTITVPSKKPVILTVKQITKSGDTIPLPDLAVADYDCVRKGKSLKVRISNLGAASSSKTAVKLYDADNTIIAVAPLPVIEAPVDFVEKSLWVEFKKIPAGYLRIVVDPGSEVKELFKGNNETIIQ